MARKENLLLMYHRPLEPCFVGKGRRKAAFMVPYNYLPDRYKTVGVQIMNSFGDDAEETIHVKEIPLPPLGEVLDLRRDNHFTLSLPWHRHLAGLLTDIFLAMRNLDELQSMAVYARDRVNPYLFNYALSVAILHRSDTKGLSVPALIYSFPDKYIDSQVFVKAREELFIVPEDSRLAIEIPKDFTASDLEFEHRIAYFREDLGINLHHWHWHLVYPFSGSMAVVNKNRRGELFYYMHQQIMARYNSERLCNHMARVKRFTDWRDPIKEAYFPKLNSLIASRNWPARDPHQRLHNVSREQDQLHADIDNLVQWRDRIVEAIHSGFIIDRSGNKIPLTENEGIDVLGNIIEASNLSPNSLYYGDLHNMGHIFIAISHDPDGRFLEAFGVMGDTTTAMRDPIFYRWHGYIDYLFQLHKATLPRYTVSQLNYTGITLTAITVQADGTPDNELSTFWQKSEVDLSGGLDFEREGSLFVRFTHLQHYPFTYNITVNNNGPPRMGTCRIFLAPRNDERGGQWLFRDQKNLFIALDRFTVNLRTGENTIVRSSTESTVTIPFEQTFRDWNAFPAESLAEFNFCGCGWPHHMLIPKGWPEGFPCHLFVMISNYSDDRIIQDTDGSCNDADNYCGVQDRLYPDRRSMGYPFDRMPRPGAETLQQFLTSNMRVQEVTIRHYNVTVTPSEAKSYFARI